MDPASSPIVSTTVFHCTHRDTTNMLRSPTDMECVSTSMWSSLTRCKAYKYLRIMLSKDFQSNFLSPHWKQKIFKQKNNFNPGLSHLIDSNCCLDVPPLSLSNCRPFVLFPIRTIISHLCTCFCICHLSVTFVQPGALPWHCVVWVQKIPWMDRQS